MDKKKIKKAMSNDSSDEIKDLKNELEILKIAFIESKGVNVLEKMLKRLEKLLNWIEVKFLWTKRKLKKQ